MTPRAHIVLTGASGGLGVSTLALAVGRRLAVAGTPCTVVDLATTAGGLDVTAGIEHLPGRRWSALAEVRGPVPPGPLLRALPHEDGCRVLSAGGLGPRSVPAVAVRDTLASVLAGPEAVVVDLPPSSPHLAGALAGEPLLVVLAGLRTRQLADVDALVERLIEAAPEEGGHPDLRLVTRGPRPSAGVLDDVLAALGIAHLDHLVDDAHVPREAERGLWPGTTRSALRRCADAVVAAGAPDVLGQAS
ncbi:hypothetical protein H9L10_11345 [Phycicoccus endophyticus]|uniref:Pilus assembly protein FlpE n=1 Tax=Phycicoccus endophyticus TaxID=1690220 RepID=A0A7G9QZU3_9MICO|nr:hypothetical protein [Phycicoccus endophyticus]NHI20067.1 hypothetical protein [Phycicoccus endophyticus]QNN48868.1 hypothetical protein H9L10_11345 [Phycicoccus endophyticus]GGL42175.1 hypothetical protein GCM10012283_25960 [Phycicoccus endophyticus]